MHEIMFTNTGKTWCGAGSKYTLVFLLLVCPLSCQSPFLPGTEDSAKDLEATGVQHQHSPRRCLSEGGRKREGHTGERDLLDLFFGFLDEGVFGCMLKVAVFPSRGEEVTPTSRGREHLSEAGKEAKPIVGTLRSRWLLWA